MPYDVSGNATISRIRAVTGEKVQAVQVNVPFDDVQAMLSELILRSGVAPMTGNLNMNGFRVTNLPVGTEDSDPVTYAQMQALLSAARVPVGARQGFFRTTAPTGWVKANGGTIGNASSGATTRANADTLDLFTLFWEQFSNTILPIQTSAGAASTRGASAAADFAANKRLPIFDLRDEYDRGADDGRGYDASLTVGASHADAIKNHKHGGTTASSGAHTHTYSRATTGDERGGGSSDDISFVNGTTGSSGDHTHTFTTDDNTGGSALETRVRAVVTLHCIKL